MDWKSIYHSSDQERERYHVIVWIQPIILIYFIHNKSKIIESRKNHIVEEIYVTAQHVLGLVPPGIHVHVHVYCIQY